MKTTSKRAASATHLYAAYCKGFAKIGLADDPKSHLASMQSGCPFPIELLGAIPLDQEAAAAAEQAALASLNDATWHGDWCRTTRNHARFVLHDVTATAESLADPPRFHRRGRPIRTPSGDFASSADAARVLGVTKQAIHRKAISGVSGWAFLDQERA